MRLVSTCVVAIALTGMVRAGEKEERAHIDVKNLTKAAEYFKKKNGNYPAKLTELATAGILDPKFDLHDPWGNDYQYDAKGKKNGSKQPDIWAVTPDKKEIGNWPAENKK
jgi:Type II secretion system (T2SS), protein G